MLRLFQQAEVVEPKQLPAGCRDPADDKFFACALLGATQYIVTEDKDILAVGSYHGVETITGTKFIELLQTKQ